MPIYEFICKPCNKRFELLISMSRVSEASCPECGSDDIKRVMSTFSARISGEGSSHSHSGCAGCAAGQCSSCSCH